MKARLYYDWSIHNSEGKHCEAILELNKDVTLYEYGYTFEEAKALVIHRAQTLPPEEEVEI